MGPVGRFQDPFRMSGMSHRRACPIRAVALFSASLIRPGSRTVTNGVWRSGLTHRFLVPALLGSNPSTPAIQKAPAGAFCPFRAVEKFFLYSTGSGDYFPGRGTVGVWRSGLTHRILIPALLGSNPSTPAITAHKKTRLQRVFLLAAPSCVTTKIPTHECPGCALRES